MSTVSEIKAAIEQLSKRERDELKAWLHPDWDRPDPQDETPPGVRERLPEAARGSFVPGSRLNISRIRSKLK